MGASARVKPVGCETSLILASSQPAPKPPHRPLAYIKPLMPKDGQTATCYAELVWLLTQFRYKAGKSQLEIDFHSGMQEGYTGKLEQPAQDYGRAAVTPMFDLWIGGLRVGLQIVPL